MMKPIFLACCGLALSATVQADSVVLWNQLGSQSDLQTSRVGPGGNYTGGGYFVPGVFGNAYAVDYPYNQDGSRLTFPVTVLPAAQGTIEFWGKLTNFPTNIAVSGVEFFQYWPNTFPSVMYRLGFASNDGCGGGGIYGSVGVAVNSYCYGLVATATGGFGGGYSYPSILGDAAAWHHYALVWNQAGLPAPVPAGHRVAVFLDGVLGSNYLQDRAPSTFGNPADYPNQVFGLIMNRETQGIVAIDNLIIRDYAKLDFSDRFQENPLATSMTPFSTFNVTRLIIDQNRGTLFIWSNFTLGGDNK